jgi:hypothetical protein
MKLRLKWELLTSSIHFLFVGILTTRIIVAALKRAAKAAAIAFVSLAHSVKQFDITCREYRQI